MLDDPNLDLRQFLDHLPVDAGCRGIAANHFLDAARQGEIVTPEVLVQFVVWRLERSLTERPAPDEANNRLVILRAIEAHPVDAGDYARWALAYAKLTKEERKQDQQRRGAPPEARWATRKQLEYLRGLGYQGHRGLTMDAAAELIDQLKRERDTQRATFAKREREYGDELIRLDLETHPDEGSPRPFGREFDLA